MVGVVVDDGHVADFTGDLEATADAAKGCQALMQVGKGKAEPATDGDGGEGVAHVVPAGKAEPGEPQGLVSGQDEEVAAAKLVGANVDSREVVVAPARFQTVGDDVDAGQVSVVEQAAHAFVIGAGHQSATGGQKVDEAVEGVAVIGWGGENVGMVVLDVGDDGDARAQPEEHIVVLVGLDDEDVAPAGAAVAAKTGQDAADDDGGIATGLQQEVGDEAGGRGLAVGTGDGNARLLGHEVAEEIGALEDGQAGGAGGHKFGVVLRDG